MPSPSSVDQLKHILCEFGAEVTRSSIGELMYIMKREEISMPQLVTLFYLRSLGTASISHIALHLSLSLGAASHLVERLVCNGFVSRTEDAADRRLKQVTLTAAGNHFLEEVRLARVDEVAHRLADMPQPLLENMLTVMQQVIAHLQSTERCDRTSADGQPAMQYQISQTER
ncbi:MAG: MarR family transcriptional regulator [Herpetosiphon sp.]